MPDRLLVQLLTAWLAPSQAAQHQHPKAPAKSAGTCTAFNPRKCCKAQLGIAVMCAEDCAKQMHKKIKTSAKERPPLQEITYIHAAIRQGLCCCWLTLHHDSVPLQTFDTGCVGADCCCMKGLHYIVAGVCAAVNTHLFMPCGAPQKLPALLRNAYLGDA